MCFCKDKHLALWLQLGQLLGWVCSLACNDSLMCSFGICLVSTGTKLINQMVFVRTTSLESLKVYFYAILPPTSISYPLMNCYFRCIKGWGGIQWTKYKMDYIHIYGEGDREREFLLMVGEMQEKTSSIWNQLFSMIDELLVSKKLNRWKEGWIKRTAHLILITYTYTWKSFCQTSWIAQDLVEESSQELSVKNASLNEEQRGRVKRNGGNHHLTRHLKWNIRFLPFYKHTYSADFGTI